MYDRTTSRLVEKNVLAYRLFTTPPPPPVRWPAPASGDHEGEATS
jgi:hypothetical protein